ncbi:MAG TPA: monovalent cation/H(+) antiporter subunit G [Burkholderiaceae bacterium]|nr:monovalent cation/H(+) antiporter subunit G [Burkholderiaceae bacterium]
MNADLPIWASVVVSVLLVTAGFFAVTGSLGLLRLPHFYSRIHAPTLANTLAAFCIVMALIVTAAVTEHRFLAHSLLISFFLIITSPVTAMLLMRAAIKRELQRREDEGRPSQDAPEVKLEGSSLPETEAVEPKGAGGSAG